MSAKLASALPKGNGNGLDAIADDLVRDPTPAFDEWCVVELLGHRRLAARVREVTLAGAGMLRLDEPATTNTQARTQYVSPGSVYALHPTTEQVVTTMCAQWATEPVSRWDLARAAEIERKALEAEAVNEFIGDHDADYGDEEDEGGPGSPY